MQKRNTALSRVVAFTALVAALLVLIVVISTSLGGEKTSDRQTTSGQTSTSHRPPKDVPASYVIHGGDTLTSIAHETGVSVHRIEVLNPAIDPQILISGQKLKLR